MKCDYCFQVYYDASEDAQMDGKLWIECDGCQKWNHTDCEIALGTDKSLKEVAMDLNNQTAMEAAGSDPVTLRQEEKPYFCMKCRRVKAAEATKRKVSELVKKAQKLKPAQSERVSTRLARATKRKQSSEAELSDE